MSKESIINFTFMWHFGPSIWKLFSVVHILGVKLALVIDTFSHAHFTSISNNIVAHMKIPPLN